jgi:glutamate 5-kinase
VCSARKNKKIVVKIGSSVLCPRGDRIDALFLGSIASQVAELAGSGTRTVIVSSGAIALGMGALKLHERPRELASLQAAAAVGQHELMHAWRDVFHSRGILCAQLLLTWEDIKDRQRYQNAKHTLHTLLEMGTVPVINENDTVATEEIKFGDNDTLSALVAVLVGADLLINLSDVDGLLDTNKQVIPHVGRITPAVRSLVCPGSSRTCVGGMAAKLNAAQIVLAAGIPYVVANGHTKGIIHSLASDPQSQGTLFMRRCQTERRER